MPKPPREDVFILPDEYKIVPRNKRAVLMKDQPNQKLNVEMLVVVDKKMMDNHGHSNITTYVLTVLNMVREISMLLLTGYGPWMFELADTRLAWESTKKMQAMIDLWTMSAVVFKIAYSVTS